MHARPVPGSESPAATYHDKSVHDDLGEPTTDRSARRTVTELFDREGYPRPKPRRRFGTGHAVVACAALAVLSMLLVRPQLPDHRLATSPPDATSTTETVLPTVANQAADIPSPTAITPDGSPTVAPTPVRSHARRKTPSAIPPTAPPPTGPFPASLAAIPGSSSWTSAPSGSPEPTTATATASSSAPSTMTVNSPPPTTSPTP